MICCVAIGALIAVAVRFWRIITLRPIRKASLFPPVAHRSAPGVVSNSDVETLESCDYSLFTTDKLMLFYGVAIAGYMVLVNALAVFDVAYIDRAGDHWSMRNLIYMLTIAAFILSVLVRNNQRKSLDGKQFIGSMITIMGIVLSVLFIADVHMFQLLSFGGGKHIHHAEHNYLAASNWLVHGFGVMLIIAGHWLFQRNSYTQIQGSN